MQISAVDAIAPPEAAALADLFRLLGDPTRTRILGALLEAGELCVGQLAGVVDAPESTVSHALRLLRTAGVVRNRRDGRTVHYALDDDHVRLVLELSLQHLRHDALAPLMGHDDHAGGHGGHAHGSISAGGRHRGRLLAAFLVLVVFMVVEVIGAWIASSLALLSDAGHMLTDVIGIGMALAAIHLAGRGSSRTHRTFGLYRLEILAALANSVLLLGVAVYVLVEAIRRFSDPADVLGGTMLVVAVAGLAANLVAFALLREGSKESLNVQGAYLEVLADTVGSVGVIIGAIVLQITGWSWIDPVVGVAIGVWIVPRALRLAGQAIRILVQAAPPGTDLDVLRADLAAVHDVIDVHDLHVWTLTSDMDVASVHLMVRTAADHHRVLDDARDVLRERYGIGHATLQVEPEDHRGCDELGW